MSEGGGEGVPHGEKIYSQSADWSQCTRYLFVEVVNMFLHILQVALRLPGIAQSRIAFPFDQMLQFPSVNSTVFDLLNLMFFRSFHQIRGRFCEIGSMCLSFLIWHEKSEVEYIMDLPMSRKG